MWHTLTAVADARRLDAAEFVKFAMASTDKYGICTDRVDPEVNTWHVDTLVNDFKVVASTFTATRCPKCSGEMRPGRALRNPTGMADVSSTKQLAGVPESWPARMTDCLKCTDCGHSEEDVEA